MDPLWVKIAELRGHHPAGMVPSTRDEVGEQLHDVTGKVLVRELRVAALVLRSKKKKKKQASLWVNWIPEAGVKDPLSGHRITTS